MNTSAKRFLGKNIVLLIAVTAAVVSSFFNKPSLEYFDFIDVKTIVCLFCMMAVIEACKNIKLFRICAYYMLKKFAQTRKLVLALVFITFLFSMFIANDMALITFLPFTYMVLKDRVSPRLVMYTIILQNIAANLGGMLTPFGNPQNLYLFSFYNIPTIDFLTIMLPPFLLSIALIFVCCMFVKKKSIEYTLTDFGKFDFKRSVIYGLMFVMTVLMVFNIINFLAGFFIVLALIVLLDRKAVLSVDYPLILTFVSFFIFAGNISKIEAVNIFLSGLVQKSPLIYGIISCQIISNVPTAILFSQFTPPSLYPQLLLAVNLGGMGTLIASLASLISFKSFTKEYKGYTLKYIGYYLLINFSLLIILTAIYIF